MQVHGYLGWGKNTIFPPPLQLGMVTQLSTDHWCGGKVFHATSQNLRRGLCPVSFFFFFTLLPGRPV